jgi:hypothetical protein
MPIFIMFFLTFFLLGLFLTFQVVENLSDENIKLLQLQRKRLGVLKSIYILCASI